MENSHDAEVVQGVSWLRVLGIHDVETCSVFLASEHASTYIEVALVLQFKRVLLRAEVRKCELERKCGHPVPILLD